MKNATRVKAAALGATLIGLSATAASETPNTMTLRMYYADEGEKVVEIIVKAMQVLSRRADAGITPTIVDDMVYFDATKQWESCLRATYEASGRKAPKLIDVMRTITRQLELTPKQRYGMANALNQAAVLNAFPNPASGERCDEDLSDPVMPGNNEFARRHGTDYQQIEGNRYGVDPTVIERAIQGADAKRILSLGVSAVALAISRAGRGTDVRPAEEAMKKFRLSIAGRDDAHTLAIMAHDIAIDSVGRAIAYASYTENKMRAQARSGP